MPLIRRADRDQVAREAVVLHLDDLARRAEKLRSEAEEAARKLVDDARAERERILAGAREAGLEKGLEEGRERGFAEGVEEGRRLVLEQARTQLASLERSWAEALDRFERDRDTFLLAARREVLGLAMLAAEMITRRQCEADPAVVVDQLGAVLELVTRPAKVVVAIHPEDDEHVRRAMPALMERFPAARGIELRHDESLSRGSCVARLDGEGGGVIDASIRTQLERIAAALVPGKDARGSKGSALGVAA